MRCWLVAVIVLWFLPTLGYASSQTAYELAIAKSQQLIVVIARHWSDNHGTLALYDRERSEVWRRASPAVPVMLGRNGLAWGIALHRQRATKREGDGCSPAGLFALQRIYGRAATPPGTGSVAGQLQKFPYQQLRESMEGVDDPHS